MNRTKYDYVSIFDELLDSALNELSPPDFDYLLDNISIMLANYESEDKT